MLDIVYSVAFALCVATGSRIVYAGNVSGDASATYMAPIGIGTVVAFLATGVLSYFFLQLLKKHRDAIEELCTHTPFATSDKKFWLCCTGALLLLWLPYLLALYPGALLPDTFTSIDQALGQRPLSNHHPVAFTLLLKVFLRAPLPFGNYGRIFLYCLMQSIALAGTASYSLVWLKRRGAGAIVLVAAFAYFALSSVFPIYAVNVQKDVPYSIALCLFSLVLVDFCGSESKPRVKEVAPVVGYAVLALMFRNNAILAIGVTYLVALICYRKHKALLKKIAFALGLTVLIAGAWQAVVAHVATPTESAELLGMPLQQVSRTIALNGSMSDEDKAFMDKVLPLEEYQSKYTPALVDTVKWAEHFDDEFLATHKTEFMLLYLRNLPANLPLYVDAFILETFGYWEPTYRDSYGYMDPGISKNSYGLEPIDLYQEFFGGTLGQNLLNYRSFLGSGTLLWITLLGFWFACTRKHNRMPCILLYLPALGSFLSILIATPVAFSLRYVFIFALALPLYCATGLLTPPEQSK